MKIPREHKEEIQRLYFRAHQLKLEWKAASEKASWTAILKWGSVLLLIASFFPRGWPDWIGATALGGSLLGWALNNDAEKVAGNASSNLLEIHRELIPFDVSMSYDYLFYYPKLNDGGSIFDPLNEDSYTT